MKDRAAVVILIFALFTNGCSVSKPSQEDQTQERRAATLAQQKMCADQAKKVFDGLDTASGKYEDYTRYDYYSHYDPKMNVCYFMTFSYGIMKLDASRAASYVVTDAFEGQTYASFLRIAKANEADYVAKPTECSVKPQGQDEIACHNEDEFEALVKKYFGVTQ
jgi:hypothetical protein